MKIYVSIDFEGLTGISSPAQLVPKSSLYSDGREIVTRFVEVITDELRRRGVNEVLVADSHGVMTNIVPWRVNATLLQGFPRPISMVLNIEGFDGAMFVGYHTAAGTIHGFLGHTYSGATFHRVYLNDIPLSEYLLNAALAGEKDVPVILVAGDEHLKNEVERFTPWAVFVPLKRGVSRYAAIYEPLNKVFEKLRKGISEALERLKKGDAKPLKLEKPYRFVFELKNEGVVDILERLRFVERLDAYTLRVVTETIEEGMLILELIAFINLGLQRLLERL